jgi:Phosphatidylinositol N-acetylglucosaminyltransferase
MVPSRSSPSKRCLWKGIEARDLSDNSRETLEEFQERFIVTAAVVDPWWKLVAVNVVVVQEVSFVVFIMYIHQWILQHEKYQESLPASNRIALIEDRLAVSIQWLLGAMLVTILGIAWGQRTSTVSTTVLNSTGATTRRTNKIQQRLIDGLLLALWLQFLSASGLLRSLTASYSTDTVERLACASMLLHVVCCDYEYANSSATINSNPRDTVPSPAAEEQTPVYYSQRPVFRGGTISLNAALFATTLLTSRFRSNATSYILFLIVLVLFCYFPISRHTFHQLYPPDRHGTSTGKLSCAMAP